MGHWLELKASQPGPNRDAIGAWIEVKVGEKTCPWLLDTVELNAWVEQEPATFGKKSR